MTEREDSYIARNISGGKKAAKTNKERYGEDFYKNIGKSGGLVQGTKGGFASPKLCICEIFDYQAHTHNRCSGSKGGQRSRRTKKPVELARGESNE